MRFTMPHGPHASLVFFAFLACGCGVDVVVDGTERPTPDRDASSLDGRVFEIARSPGEEGISGCVGDCLPATVLIERHQESHLELTWGASGRAALLSLRETTAGWVTEEALFLGGRQKSSFEICENFSELEPGAEFRFADDDRDGTLELTVTGRLRTQYCSDDYGGVSEQDVILKGSPGRRLPKLLGTTDKSVPLDGVHVNLDKPLAATSTALLKSAGISFPLTPRIAEGYVVGFDSDEVLPLGAKLTLSVSGNDFTGDPGPEDVLYGTVADFGVLVEDGFESGSSLGVSGAAIVEDFRVPPLSGQRMLTVAPGVLALLHLKRSGAETKLVFDARVFDECGGGPGIVRVRVAAIGSAEVGTEQLDIGDPQLVESGEGGPFWIGDEGHFRLPLSREGEEFLVSFEGPSYRGIDCSEIGALVDDVHLE